jgi:hypothetical protein
LLVAPGAYPRRKHLKGTPIGLALALPSNSKNWLERVSKDKPSSLLGLIDSDEGKKFYNIDTWLVFCKKSCDELTTKMVSSSGFLFTKLHRIDLKEWPTELQKANTRGEYFRGHIWGKIQDPSLASPKLD